MQFWSSYSPDCLRSPLFTPVSWRSFTNSSPLLSGVAQMIMVNYICPLHRLLNPLYTQIPPTYRRNSPFTISSLIAEAGKMTVVGGLCGSGSCASGQDTSFGKGGKRARPECGVLALVPISWCVTGSPFRYRNTLCMSFCIFANVLIPVFLT